MLRRAAVTSAGLGLLLAAVGACADPRSASRADGRLEVVAAFYPLEHVVARVGGDHVVVTSLTKPGVEPHDVELTPRDVAAVSRARVAVYEKGFQPAVDQAVADEGGAAAFDVSPAADLMTAAQEGEHQHAGHDHGEQGHAAPDVAGSESVDPHFWLDPTRYAKVARAVATRLAQTDPAHRADYVKNAEAFARELTALDREFTAGLKQCTSRNLVTSHAAFGYLANRYDLEQVAISGLSPESEPDPARLAQIADFARTSGVRAIYTETLVSPAVAQTIARETGVTAAVLDPIEGISDASAAGDYLGIMRHNLATLQKGQGCS